MTSIPISWASKVFGHLPISRHPCPKNEHYYRGKDTEVVMQYIHPKLGIRASNLFAKILLLPLFQSLFSETVSDISNKSTTVPQPSLNNPIITDSSKINPSTLESHSVQITMICLNGDNFLRWSQSVRMYIKGRGKMGYLMGEKKAPAVDDPNYAIWDAENSMVMTWLVNSMEEDISSNYMCYPIAQELWENVNQMYSDLGNQSQIFELTLKLGEIRQGEHLLALLKSNLTSGTSSVSLAHTGNELYALSCCFKSTPWIIDSGASDHMTNSSNMFESYSPCPGNKKDQSSGKTIGSARMINGLYYFKDNLPSNKIAQGLSSISSLSVRDQIMVWHCRLGNPPSIPTHIHASSSSVTNLSLPSHFGPSPEISALEPGLGLAPIVPAQDLDLDLPIVLRKGIQAYTKHPIAKYISYSNLSDNYRAFTTNISKLVNGTWEVVDLPREKKVVGCKWMFTIKSKADGSVERYKARLVAKGFTQTYGIDYQEIFAPVAKINSIRVLLSLTVNSNWPLHQLDVKNVFLNGDLEEEVFMSPPPSFEESFGVGKVCKLKKSLYGLKQSPKAWFERFGKVIKHYGYTQSQADHTMFYKHSNEGKVVILIVYVDDIVLTGDDCNELEKLKGKLAEEFEIKDLEALKYFLGMEFARSKEDIFVNQRKYALDLLDETGMLGCKPAETPIELNVKLQPTKAKNVKDRDCYHRLVGRLIYLSHTRPDIAFSVTMVSQFMHAPRPEHFEVVYRILRYLKGTPGGNLVMWRSKKQNVIAISSAEAEFRVVAHGICEIMWIRRLLEELKMTGSSPMKLYCDNKAAISVAHNPILHDRTKHVEVDKHFIKEKIDKGLVCMTYIPTEEQVVDVFTKGLHKRQFDFLVGKLAMEDIFKPA
ncbi:Retrovirus-related Pol polyprotein from transposon RE1 [Vitis vinifera]|uniref:Retrovirus-related Pol polyprotein from transposon RE1 n=1 Tax=Vitis vinifera TaxID=29760 RepID=A0A438I8D6_VITVI|nr:Retrovirus-related Pol polyprotein from transposon RE1 [Vitis vinifera]